MSLHEKFLKIFGDIKIFKWPLFFIYQPTGYKVKGKDIHKILKVLREGDILLRGYNDYLDGKFIPGIFSHAGFYLGKNEVIHSIAEGVIKEHILDFCRCDRIAVIRVKGFTGQELEDAKGLAETFLGCSYDFDFIHNNNKLYCSELVNRIWKHKVNTPPTKIKLFGIFRKEVILPDQFYRSKDMKVIKEIL